MKKGFVFVTGGGLAKFHANEKVDWTFEDGSTEPQWRGIVRLPKGSRMGNGDDFKSLDYWFCKHEIFKTKKEAIKSIK